MRYVDEVYIGRRYVDDVKIVSKDDISIRCSDDEVY
jgi:glycerol-3-phosphate cytidylyltransferase-like family protein